MVIVWNGSGEMAMHLAEATYTGAKASGGNAKSMDWRARDHSVSTIQLLPLNASVPISREQQAAVQNLSDVYGLSAGRPLHLIRDTPTTATLPAPSAPCPSCIRT